MELIEFEELSDQQRAELTGDEEDPFEVGEVTLRFRPKERHVALRDSDGRLIASAGLVLAEVQVADERFPVVGLGGVIVNAAFRRRGLAREVVEAAITRAQALGPPFAVLFCLEDRTGLYRRLSFTEITGEVLVEQPDGYETMPLRTMWRPLRPGLLWPAGPVVLRGHPF